MENKKFCIKPFNSLQIGTSGKVRTCCEILPNLTEYRGKTNFNIKRESINDYWTSDYLEHLRKKFLNGERPKECQRCWNEESDGVTSLRQFSNRQYKVIGNKNPAQYLEILKKQNLEHPEDYNLDISNLCNLKCYMCDGGSSSKMLVENNALGIEKLNQKDYEYTDDRVEYLIKQIVENNVTHLTLQGGEPLMNPKIIKILQKLSVKQYAKKISIWITTNGTIYSDNIFNILKKFGSVKIIFSVDGVGRVNDYLRFPSKFSEIESNIKKYKRLNNATFMITCVVQNFNLLNVKEMIDFAHDMSIHLYLRPLYEPSYLHLHILPTHTRKKVIEKLNAITKEKLLHVTNFESLLGLIENKVNHVDVIKMQKFKDMVLLRDRYRKIDIKNFIPDLAKDLNI